MNGWDGWILRLVRSRALIAPVIAVAILIGALVAAPAGAQDPPPPPPPCAAEVAAALAFKDLPSQLLAGRRYVFGVAPTAAGGNTPHPPGAAKMVDVDSGREIFTGQLDNFDEELFIRHALGDGPTDITLSYREQAPDGTSCTRTLATRVVTLNRVFLPNKCKRGVQRPRRVKLNSSNGAIRLHGMRWSTFNGSVARGRGVVAVNTCRPTCTSGRFINYSVSVRASRPSHCESAGRYHYTRISLTFRGARPLDASRTESINYAPCWAL